MIEATMAFIAKERAKFTSKSSNVNSVAKFFTTLDDAQIYLVGNNSNNYFYNDYNNAGVFGAKSYTNNTYEVYLGTMQNKIINKIAYFKPDNIYLDTQTNIKGNLTVAGILNASNLNITGQTTYITTNTYQTENLEITTSANDGVPALKVTQSGGLNVAEFYDTDSNVFIVKKGGNVGIATTNPLDRLHVIGNIRFSQNINGITSNELSTLTGINGNIQTQFTNTSNYVLSTSNFLANAATTASNNIINRINTFYDVNQSNYVISTSNFLANAATTASNNIINRINTFYDINHSNYVVSTSNFLANTTTTASNNIINRINTFYDVNQSNYVLSTSNILANAATTASNNIINRINTFYDINHSNYVVSTSNFLANAAITASNNIINRINTFYDINHSNYVVSTSNLLANATTTASNNIINRINTFYDVNQSNYVVSTSNFLANTTTTASNNIINRINTFYDANQSNFVVSTSNFLANAATTASNNIINRINTFYDVNQSNYVVSTSNILANAATTASNNIINRINTFYDVNQSNYVVSTSNFLANAATTASNNIINRINTFYDVNQSNYVVSTSNFLANAATTASNNIINRINTFYDVNQSNYVSSINARITNLNLDQVANGLSNKYIINNVYNANLTVTGTLNASNLNITGQTTYITTNTYQTENLEITTSANDGVPALKVTQSGGLNVAEFYDTDSNVFIIKKGGNVGIATTNPLDRLHVIGNIRFSQNINGITSNELSTLTAINGNIQTQFTNTSNYVLSTSNILANVATTASNNIINRINTYYDINQSNYVLATSNTFFASLNRIATFTSNTISLETHTTIKGNFIPFSNITYDLGSSNFKWRDLYLSGNTIYLQDTRISSDPITKGIVIRNNNDEIADIVTSTIKMKGPDSVLTELKRVNNKIILQSSNAAGILIDDIDISSLQTNISNYVVLTSNFLANAATTSSNNIINRINTFYDANQSNYVVSTSNFLANAATTASNNIINRINTFYDANQSNYVVSTSNFLANAATTASNNIINRINIFYDVNHSNYVLSTSNFLANAATIASNNIINRINIFYDVNHSNYVLSTSNFLANAATTASNNIINRINTFYDVNHSNYVLSTSNFLQTQINNKEKTITVLPVSKGGTSISTIPSNRLLGSGGLSDTIQAITLGTGISLSSGSLSASPYTGADNRFTTLNTNDIYIDNLSAKLGIGTNNVSSNLHIHTSVTNNNNATVGIRLTNTDTGTQGTNGLSLHSFRSDGYLWNYYNSNLIFGTSNVERMRILANGNVGIGTNNPQTNLHINGKLVVHDNGVNIPSAESLWSAGNGTRIVLCPVSTTQSPYSIGIETNTLWMNTDSTFKWYANSIEQMRLVCGTGRFLQIYSSSYDGGADNFRYFNYSSSLTQSTGGIPTDVCLITDSGIWCRGTMYASSDRRVKKDLQILDDNEALQRLLKIEPKKYKYIDEINQGINNYVFGFEAQQVKQHFPDAISLRKSIIPNIYETCEYTSNGIYFNNTSNIDLSSNTPIDVISLDGTRKVYKIEEYSNNYIKLDKKIENSSNVFIYGTEVSDFHTLNKDYLFTINFCATQELYRIIQRQQDQLDELKNLILRISSNITI